MNTFFYIIIFIMGITFGSFYTLAVYRIPKGEDIMYTHSYCPNCQHRLGFLDLIPVFSYIFLGAKCRYCKQKIRPRYLILEIISGMFFVVIAYLMKLSIYDVNIIEYIEFFFLILYFTFIILISGINKENLTISKPVLLYGIVISIMYIIYLYIVEKTSIYRYVIYLILSILFFIIGKINNKKHNGVFLLISTICIMVIFLQEFIVISSIITAIIAISIYSIIKKVDNANKENQEFKKIAFYISIYNIIYFIIVLANYKFA